MRRHRPHRGSSGAPLTAYGENSRSPHMTQTPPSIAGMASRHSWQTGRREIFTSGVPQMRQSEGNKTAKRLSAILRVQLGSARSLSVPEAIEGPATAALAWLARVLSPLLLKTASVWPAGKYFWGGRLCDCLLD